jgi:hypothetical protein
MLARFRAVPAIAVGRLPSASDVTSFGGAG